MPPRVTTAVEGSLGDRIDDALDPDYEDLEAINALLREVAHARFVHGGVKSLEVKKMMLEQRFGVGGAAASGSGASQQDDVVERMRKMSVASQQRIAMQRAKEESELFKPDIGKSAQLVGNRRGSIFDRMDEETARQRQALEAREKSIDDEIVRTASSPRLAAGASPENQKRHDEMADKARERVLGRRGSVFELADEYEAKRQQEINKKRTEIEAELMSPVAGKPKLSKDAEERKLADAANGKAAWNRRDHQKQALEEEEKRQVEAEARAKADAEEMAAAELARKHKAATRRMSETWASGAEMRRAAKEHARMMEEEAKQAAEEEEEAKRLEEVQRQKDRTAKVLANARRKSIVEGGGLVEGRVTAEQKAEARRVAEEKERKRERKQRARARKAAKRASREVDQVGSPVDYRRKAASSSAWANMSTRDQHKDHFLGTPEKTTPKKVAARPHSSPRPGGAKSKAGGSIFDRLTDATAYTGAHKMRFDKQGRGRGKLGRQDSQAVISDISQIVNAHKADHQGLSTRKIAGAGKPVAETQRLPGKRRKRGKRKPKPKADQTSSSDDGTRAQMSSSMADNRRMSLIAEDEESEDESDSSVTTDCSSTDSDSEDGEEMEQDGEDEDDEDKLEWEEDTNGGGARDEPRGEGNSVHAPTEPDGIERVEEFKAPASLEQADTDDRHAVESLIDVGEEPSPPTDIVNATAQRVNKSGAQKRHKAKAAGSIFDRLTDTSEYTGAHKMRFDQSGRGRGKLGRQESQAVISDLSQIVGTHKVDHQGLSVRKVASVDAGAQARVKTKKRSPKASPTRQRISQASPSRQRTPTRRARSATPETRSASRRRRSPHSAQNRAKTPRSQQGNSIFDRLTDTSEYTGAHKMRFDQSGRGRGKLGRQESQAVISDLSQIVGTHKVDHQGLSVRKVADSTQRLVIPPAQQRSPARDQRSTTPERGSPRRLSGIASTRSASSAQSAGSGGNIFDKLTDATAYTGAHKMRFDKDGKGRGKLGRRESQAVISDLSQIVGVHKVDHQGLSTRKVAERYVETVSRDLQSPRESSHKTQRWQALEAIAAVELESKAAKSHVENQTGRPSWRPAGQLGVKQEQPPILNMSAQQEEGLLGSHPLHHWRSSSPRARSPRTSPRRSRSQTSPSSTPSSKSAVSQRIKSHPSRNVEQALQLQQTMSVVQGQLHTILEHMKQLEQSNQSLITRLERLRTGNDGDTERGQAEVQEELCANTARVQELRAQAASLLTQMSAHSVSVSLDESSEDEDGEWAIAVARSRNDAIERERERLANGSALSSLSSASNSSHQTAAEGHRSQRPESTNQVPMWLETETRAQQPQVASGASLTEPTERAILEVVKPTQHGPDPAIAAAIEAAAFKATEAVEAKYAELLAAQARETEKAAAALEAERESRSKAEAKIAEAQQAAASDTDYVLSFRSAEVDDEVSETAADIQITPKVQLQAAKQRPEVESLESAHPLDQTHAAMARQRAAAQVAEKTHMIETKVAALEASHVSQLQALQVDSSASRAPMVQSEVAPPGSPRDIKKERFGAVDVTCPEGVGPGDVIYLQYDGEEVEVRIPDGVQPGDEFEVNLESGNAEPLNQTSTASTAGQRAMAELDNNSDEGDSEWSMAIARSRHHAMQREGVHTGDSFDSSLDAGVAEPAEASSNTFTATHNATQELHQQGPGLEPGLAVGLKSCSAEKADRTSTTAATEQTATQQLQLKRFEPGLDTGRQPETETDADIQPQTQVQPTSSIRRYSMSLSQGALHNLLSVVDLPDDVAEEATETLDVTCPEGVGPGDVIYLQYDGEEVEVRIPDGVQPGDEFEVNLESGNAEPLNQTSTASASERKPKLQHEERQEQHQERQEQQQDEQQQHEQQSHLKAKAQWQSKRQQPPTKTTSQVIVNETEDELEIQIGERLFLVDTASTMVFQIEPPKEAEVGTWDAEKRLIVFAEPLATHSPEPEPETMVDESLPMSDPVFAELAFLIDDLADKDGSSVVETIEVTVPEGSAPGDVISLDLSGGRELDVEIPLGLNPGELFEIELENDNEDGDVVEEINASISSDRSLTTASKPVIVQGPALSAASAVAVAVATGAKPSSKPAAAHALQRSDSPGEFSDSEWDEARAGDAVGHSRDTHERRRDAQQADRERVDVDDHADSSTPYPLSDKATVNRHQHTVETQATEVSDPFVESGHPLEDYRLAVTKDRLENEAAVAELDTHTTVGAMEARYQSLAVERARETAMRADTIDTERDDRKQAEELDVGPQAVVESAPGAAAAPAAAEVVTNSMNPRMAANLDFWSDSDSDGHVSAGTDAEDESIDDMLLQKVWASADVDGSGDLDADEVLQVLLNMGHTREEIDIGFTMSQILRGDYESGSTVDFDSFKQWFFQLDQDDQQAVYIVHYATTSGEKSTNLKALIQLVAEGTITPETMVWLDGMSDWMPLRDAQQLTGNADTDSETHGAAAVGQALRQSIEDAPPEQQSALIDTVWKRADVDGNGSLDRAELQIVLEQMGRTRLEAAEQVDSVLAQIDTNGNGVIQYDEFKVYWLSRVVES
eukprot:COSAG02_NODE_660_length_18763_cov_116.476425_7_plen_2551_part_00